MKKIYRFAILSLLILILGSMTAVHAELIPPYGEGQIGLQAVVLCDSLTVHAKPDASSEATETLEYGRMIILQKIQDGWAECFLSDAEGTGPAGWVNTEYLAVDPAWYVTDADTPVYAWNDTNAPKVALLEKDTQLAVLKIEEDWLVVSLRGAAGWIRK